MKRSLTLGFALALVLSPPVFAQDVINNPAISVETVEELQAKIADLEAKLADAQDFVSTRQPDLLELREKIANADNDTTKIIAELQRNEPLLDDERPVFRITRLVQPNWDPGP